MPQQPVDRNRERLNLVAGGLVVFIGMIWVIVFIDRVVLPFICRSGVEFTMPDLRYKSFAVVDSICRNAKLDLLPARMRTDDKVRPGLVIDQYPEAGSIVKPGRRTEIVISGTIGLIACPDLIGKSPREAALIADSTGLWINTQDIRYSFSENDPEGVIVDQSPFALTGLMRGAEIRITVSLGVAPTNPVVPDLTGVTLENAALMLRKQGLRLGEVVKYQIRNHHPGTVIEQSVPAGEPVGDRQIVNVRIAVEPLENNDIEGDSILIDYEAGATPEGEHE